ncbi:MAG: hypothetical protein ACF8NJ_08560 [Phycisphaerales bacterium JB038]
MSKIKPTRCVSAAGLLALTLLVTGCAEPIGYRLVTHLPSGRNYYTYSDELEQLSGTGQLRFIDHSRDATVTLRLRNVQVEEISQVRFEQAITEIAP